MSDEAMAPRLIATKAFGIMKGIEGVGTGGALRWQMAEDYNLLLYQFKKACPKCAALAPPSFHKGTNDGDYAASRMDELYINVCQIYNMAESYGESNGDDDE